MSPAGQTGATRSTVLYIQVDGFEQNKHTGQGCLQRSFAHAPFACVMNAGSHTAATHPVIRWLVAYPEFSQYLMYYTV